MLLSPVNNLFWKGVAWMASRPVVADYLIRRAQRTPYFHLKGYMDRYWLFNRYSEIGSMTVIKKRFPFLPSIRIHHILRADLSPDKHDHPWNARTIILKNGYTEDRLIRRVPGVHSDYDITYFRKAGDTAPLRFGEYHNITEVHPEGAWTLFITHKYMGTWGFMVNGVKILHNEYVEKRIDE